MEKPQLTPTAENTYKIVYPAGRGKDYPYDFGGALAASREQERRGEIEAACNPRYAAFQRLLEVIPDDEEVTLEWEDENNQSAMLLVSCSAIDHFLVGDFEMCAGMLEMLLDIDPEDHLEATKTLAYAYVALEEYELFDEVINDISDKYPEKEILKLWSEFRRNGVLPQGELIHFRKSFSVFFSEFTADGHEVTPEYLADIESDRPSRETLARELWLQTEHLWSLFPGFIEALRAA